ncbi:hypothetical protein IWQ60_003102, partial [Tieghemiomyces parasiticus]
MSNEPYLYALLNQAITQHDIEECWGVFQQLQLIPGQLETMPCALWRDLLVAFALAEAKRKAVRPARFSSPSRAEGRTAAAEHSETAPQFFSQVAYQYDHGFPRLGAFLLRIPPTTNPILRERLAILCKTWFSTFPTGLADRATVVEPYDPGPEVTEIDPFSRLNVDTVPSEFSFATDADDTTPSSTRPHMSGDYRTLLLMYAQLQDPVGAEAVIANLVSRGIRPPTPELNALLQAYRGADDYSGLLRALGQFRQHDRAWDRFTYAIVTYAATTAGDLTRADRLLAEMVTQGGHTPLARQYSELILAHANNFVYGSPVVGPKTPAVRNRLLQLRQGKLQHQRPIVHVKQLFQTLRRQPGVIWTSRAVDGLIQALAQVGDIDMAWALFYELLRVRDPGADLESETPKPVDQFTVTYGSQDSQPTVYTYSIMVSALLAADRLKAVEAVYKYLGRRMLQPPPPPAEPVPQPEGDARPTLPRAVKLPGTLEQANHTLLTDFMLGFARMGHAPTVQTIFDSILWRGLPIRNLHLHKVLSAFAVLRDVDRVLAIFERLATLDPTVAPTLRRLGAPPDRVSDLAATMDRLVPMNGPASGLTSHVASIVINCCLHSYGRQWLTRVYHILQTRPDLLASSIVRLDLISAFSIIHHPEYALGELGAWLRESSKDGMAGGSGGNFSFGEHRAINGLAPGSQDEVKVVIPDTLTAEDFDRFQMNAVHARRLLIALTRLHYWRSAVALLRYLRRRFNSDVDPTCRSLLQRLAVNNQAATAFLELLGATDTSTEDAESRPASRLSKPVPNSLPIELLYSHMGTHDERAAISIIMEAVEHPNGHLTTDEATAMIDVALKFKLIPLAQFILSSMRVGIMDVAAFKKILTGVQEQVGTVTTSIIDKLIDLDVVPSAPDASSGSAAPIASDDSNHSSAHTIAVGRPDSKTYVLIIQGLRLLRAWKEITEVTESLLAQYRPSAAVSSGRNSAKSGSGLSASPSAINSEVLVNIVLAHGYQGDTARMGRVLGLIAAQSETLGQAHAPRMPIMVWNTLIFAYGQARCYTVCTTLFNQLHGTFVRQNSAERPLTIPVPPPSRAAGGEGEPEESVRRAKQTILNLSQLAAPSEATYNAILKAARLSGEYQALPAILECFKQSGIYHSPRFYFEAVRTLLDAGDVDTTTALALPYARKCRVLIEPRTAGVISQYFLECHRPHHLEIMLANPFDTEVAPLPDLTHPLPAAGDTTTADLPDANSATALSTPIVASPVFRVDPDRRLIFMGAPTGPSGDRHYGILPVDHVTLKALMNSWLYFRRFTRADYWLNQAQTLKTNDPAYAALNPDQRARWEEVVHAFKSKIG